MSFTNVENAPSPNNRQSRQSPGGHHGKSGPRKFLRELRIQNIVTNGSFSRKSCEAQSECDDTKSPELVSPASRVRSRASHRAIDRIKKQASMDDGETRPPTPYAVPPLMIGSPTSSAWAKLHPDAAKRIVGSPQQFFPEHSSTPTALIYPTSPEAPTVETLEPQSPARFEHRSRLSSDL